MGGNASGYKMFVKADLSDNVHWALRRNEKLAARNHGLSCFIVEVDQGHESFFSHSSAANDNQFGIHG